MSLDYYTKKLVHILTSRKLNNHYNHLVNAHVIPFVSAREPIPVNKVMMIKLDFMMNGSRKRVYGFGNNKKNAKKAAAKMALRVMNT